MSQIPVPARPTAAFVGASWVALVIALLAYGVGLWNAELDPSEKGFLGTLLLLGLFSAIAVQKSVRDRAEGVPVTGIFLGLSWAMVLTSLVLVSIGAGQRAAGAVGEGLLRAELHDGAVLGGRRPEERPRPGRVRARPGGAEARSSSRTPRRPSGSEPT